MIAPAVRNWFGRGDGVAPRAEPPPLAMPPPAPQPARLAQPPAWPRDRIGVADALWGEGFVFPGGEIETLRLARPLGLSAEAQLLLLGAGSGGPAIAAASNLGVWVTGYEVDPDLVEAANERAIRARLGRRVHVETWDPEEPVLAPHAHHHCLAIEPLCGARLEPMLSAVAQALKPGGQVMMTELVADQPLDPDDPTVQHWTRMERRDPAAFPAERHVTRVLGRLGFDVKTTEDLSRRHMDEALLGWRTRVRMLEDNRPAAHEARLLVAEAEMWLMRLRLFRQGRLRLVRWHAVGRV